MVTEDEHWHIPRQLQGQILEESHSGTMAGLAVDRLYAAYVIPGSGKECTQMCTSVAVTAQNVPYVVGGTGSQNHLYIQYQFRGDSRS